MAFFDPIQRPLLAITRLYFRPLADLDFKHGPAHLVRCGHYPTASQRDHAMTLPYVRNDVRDVDRSEADDETPTTAMFIELLATACHGGDPMRQAVQVARLKQLICVRAWSDAAMALVTLRLPEWKLRRLVYDDGEWLCTLSRYRDMPDWLDQTVEAHHTNMPRAIVGALLEAINTPEPSDLSAIAKQDPDESFAVMPCENYF